MEWAEWLEIVDNFPKDDKVALDKIDTELEELEKDGLIERGPFQMKVTEIGKPFIRNICLTLDTHYWAKQPKKELFSKVV